MSRVMRRRTIRPGRSAGAWPTSGMTLLDARKGEIPLAEVKLVAYPDVGSNNADLPADGFLLDGALPDVADELERLGKRVSFEQVFAVTQLFLAPTEYSTTAPLKNRGQALPLPGGDHARLRRRDDPGPAHRLRRGGAARGGPENKARAQADHADISFTVDGKSDHDIHFDLRRRTAHASSGRFPELGTAGNLPSGEAYIVPYEGEAGEASRTAGTLPVEIDGEIVLFTIRGQPRRGGGRRRAGRPRPNAPTWPAEPAYGNMAELGFGVLADFGLEPIGEILLDEKLGLHIAFGRSDHFGGVVGPKDFSSPAAVIHLDRIYIPRAQPRVAVREVILGYPDGRRETIMADGAYTIF